MRRREMVIVLFLFLCVTPALLVAQEPTGSTPVETRAGTEALPEPSPTPPPEPAVPEHAAELEEAAAATGPDSEALAADLQAPVDKAETAADADALAPPTAQPGPGTLLVLDRKAGQLHELEVPTGTRLRSLSLPGEYPAGMTVSPDGSRVLVLHGFAFSNLSGRPKSRVSMSIVDLDAFAILSTVQLGMGWHDYDLHQPVMGSKYLTLGFDSVLMSGDGRLFAVICPGVRSKKRGTPQELVVVDLASGKLAARAAIGQPKGNAEIVIVSTTSAIAYQPALARSKQAPTPAQLFFVDLATGSVSTTLSFELQVTEWALAPDLKRLYVLGTEKVPGRPPQSTVQVVDLAEESLETTIPVARKSRLVPDLARNRILALGLGEPEVQGKAPGGELMVISGTEVATRVVLADEPAFVRRSGIADELVVLGQETLSVLDAGTWGVKRSFTVAPTAPGKSQQGHAQQLHDVVDLVVSPDGSRLFVLFSNGEKLATLDLEAGQLQTAVSVGRTLEKIGQAMAAEAHGFVYSAASAGMASRYHSPVLGDMWRPQYAIGASRDGLSSETGTLIVRPDGKYAYATHSGTEDVTVVESMTGSVVDKVALSMSSRSPVFILPESRMIVGSGPEMKFFSTETNQIAHRVNVIGAGQIAGVFWHADMSPDGSYVAAASTRHAMIVDTRTGSVVCKVPGFKHVIRVRFTPPRS